ncbi:hypothetical protein Tco_0295893 [Tanacetum coccineum]
MSDVVLLVNFQLPRSVHHIVSVLIVEKLLPNPHPNRTSGSSESPTNLFWNFGKFYSRTGNPWSRITTVLLIVNELIRTQLAKLQQCKLNVHFSTYFTRMTQRQRDRQTNYTSSESVSVSDEDSDPEQGSEGQGNAKESWVTPLQMKPVRVKVLKIMRIQGKDDDVQTSEKGVPLQADWLEDTGMKIDQEQRNWMHITATWEKDSDVLTEESGSIGQHWNRFAPEREETMTLENESRSKLNKDKVKPYDYTNQNSLYEIFKGPSLEYLYQLDRRNNEVRKTMWRKRC